MPPTSVLSSRVSSAAMRSGTISCTKRRSLMACSALQMRVQCVGVLPVPGDAEPPGELFRRRDRVGRIGGLPVLRLQADEPRCLEQALGPRHAPGRRRQRFRTPGDHHPGLAQRHGAHAEQDRIEAGGALAIHGEGGNAVPQPRGEADDAGGIAARRGVAEDDLLDRRGLEPRVLERGLHHGRRQALDAPAPVQAAGPAERGPARGNDVCRSQRRGRGHGERIRTGALRRKPRGPLAAGSGSCP